MIAASKAAMRGVTVLKAADDKTRSLNKHTLMAYSGEAGDTVQFAEYIQANAQLYSMRNNTDLSPAALANFVRGELASSLRSRKPYNVNLLLGGVDPITHKPSLYWLDYLASLAPLPYAAHGYAQYVSPCRVDLVRLLMLLAQILLPVHPRQAPPPRHHAPPGHQDPQHVHGRAQEEAANRL